MALSKSRSSLASFSFSEDSKIAFKSKVKLNQTHLTLLVKGPQSLAFSSPSLPLYKSSLTSAFSSSKLSHRSRRFDISRLHAATEASASSLLFSASAIPPIRVRIRALYSFLHLRFLQLGLGLGLFTLFCICDVSQSRSG